MGKRLLDPSGPRSVFGVLCKPFKRMAGTTGLEPAASAVTGQRSNQLNYVPSLFSYRYWKPAYLLVFLTFNRFACVAHFNLIEPNFEVNGHQGHQAEPLSKNCVAGKHQPRAAVPAP